MKKNIFWSKGWLLFSVFAGSATWMNGLAHAQTFAPSVYVWDGDISQATPGSWGNGDAKVANERGGSKVLNITTRNLYEGARFDLKNPLDLEPYLQDGYLKLRVRWASPTSTRGGRGMAGAMTAPMGGAIMPGMPMGTTGGMMPQPGMPQNAPQMGGTAQDGGSSRRGWRGRGGRGQSSRPPLSQIQVILIREKGAMFGTINVDENARPDNEGFQTTMMRLREMRATPDASGPIRRILLTGDKEATFALGQAALVVESDDMQVSIRRSQDPVGTQTGEITVRPGIPFDLVADVEAGISDVQVLWNFDADNAGLPLPTARTGGRTAMPGTMMPGAGMGMPGMGMPGAGTMQPGMPGTMGMPGMGGMGNMAMQGRVDEVGLSAALKFPNEEQDYRVEVTVRDRAGRKPDAKASILVRVRA